MLEDIPAWRISVIILGLFFMSIVLWVLWLRWMTQKRPIGYRESKMLKKRLMCSVYDPERLLVEDDEQTM